MSLRIDYQELKASLRDALITEKHSISNGFADINLHMRDLNLNEMHIEMELKSIGKPPVEAYELVPPPKTLEATDLNVHLQIAIKIGLPHGAKNKISLDIAGNIHKPVYDFIAVHSRIDIHAIKFGCLMNVALVNGHVVVWGSDVVLEPAISISGTDAFLSSYLIESTKQFLTVHFSQLQHIFSI